MNKINLPLHSRNEGRKKGGDAEWGRRESQSEFGGKTKEGKMRVDPDKKERSQSDSDGQKMKF